MQYETEIAIRHGYKNMGNRNPLTSVIVFYTSTVNHILQNI